MQKVEIFLPEHIKLFIDAQMAQGRCRDASEYVLELILADRERIAGDRLEGLLLDGMEGPEAAMEPDDWEDIRNEVRTRADDAPK
jgi:antitoxin ParD1/3/4